MLIIPAIITITLSSASPMAKSTTSSDDISLENPSNSYDCGNQALDAGT